MVSIIILSLTSDCNLKCIGCYANKRSEDCDVIKIMKGLNILMRRYSINRIIFHGGEPLIIGKEKFEEIVNFIRHIKSDIRLSIQTNATLIDEEWIEIFKKYNISIGVSYRGRKELFEELSGGNYDDFLRGISLLKENNMLSGAIFYFPLEYEDIVYNELECIIDDIVELGIKGVSFHAPIEKGKMNKYADINIEAQEYIFKKGYNLRVKDLNMIYNCITCNKNSYRGCIWRHNCYEYMTLTGQGEMFWCNRRPKSYKVLYDECLFCPIFGLCEGGCEKIREVNDGKYPYCEDMIRMYKYVVENINKFHLHYDFLR